MAVRHIYVNAPVVDMREDPSHESRIASQALFGEDVMIVQEEGDWLLIETPDQYRGWIQRGNLDELDQVYQTDLVITRIRANIYGVADTEYGPLMTLTFGARLKVIRNDDVRWIHIELPCGKSCYVQRGDTLDPPCLLYKSELPELAKRFINIMYVWGGRSSEGYDCSGFMQMLYKWILINLPRDSKQQVLDARFQEVEVDDAEPGDLLFFGKSKERVSHVGMYTGNREFIHSTVAEGKPWIHISLLTDQLWSGTEESHFPYRTARQLKT